MARHFHATVAIVVPYSIRDKIGPARRFKLNRRVPPVARAHWPRRDRGRALPSETPDRLGDRITAAVRDSLAATVTVRPGTASLSANSESASELQRGGAIEQGIRRLSLDRVRFPGPE
jgi:hypothetical protein